MNIVTTINAVTDGVVIEAGEVTLSREWVDGDWDVEIAESVRRTAIPALLWDVLSELRCRFLDAAQQHEAVYAAAMGSAWTALTAYFYDWLSASVEDALPLEVIL